MSRSTTSRLPVAVAVLAAVGLVLAVLGPASSSDRTESRDRSAAAQAKKIAKKALRTARMNAPVVVTRGTVDNPNLTTFRSVQSLRLKPGRWLIVADVGGGNNSQVQKGRMECSLVAPNRGSLDFAKAGTEPGEFSGNGAASAALALHGATTVRRTGFADLKCGTVGQAAFTLTTAKMTAVRVSTIQTQ